MEVTGNGTAALGRVLSLQERERTVGGVTESVQDLTIVTDAGVMRTFTLGPGVAVRLAEPDMRTNSPVSPPRWLDTRPGRPPPAHRYRGHGPARPVCQLRERSAGEFHYRLVLCERGRAPFLQGWAIVDNTLGEDWTDVELSLVAGAPQSFVQHISQPLYTRRPVIPLPNTALLTPQTHDATMQTFEKAGVADAVVAEASARDAAGRGGWQHARRAAPRPAMAPRFRATVNESALMERMSRLLPRRPRRAPSSVTCSSTSSPSRSRCVATSSPLVPIVQADVTVERVSLWSATQGTPRPLRAIWLTNDTGLTLDGGSLSLVEGGAFAGEGLLDSIQPKEKRLISYAVDLAGRVTVSRDGGSRRVSRIRIARGAFVQVVQERGTSTYTLRNEDTAPRTFVIEHARRDGWNLATGAPTPAESTAGTHRFRVVVAPKTYQDLKIEESRDVESPGRRHDHHQRPGRADPSGAHARCRRWSRNCARCWPRTPRSPRIQATLRDRRAEIERIEQDQTRVATTSRPSRPARKSASWSRATPRSSTRRKIAWWCCARTSRTSRCSARRPRRNWCVWPTPSRSTSRCHRPA